MAASPGRARTAPTAGIGRVPRRLLGALALGLLAALLFGCGGTKTAAPPSGGAQATSGSGSSLAPSSPTTGMRTVKVSALPPEAVDTLELIAAGGPYPYSKDGVTFQNREGHLPKAPNGFYQEYTVVTPGSSDRGARRIISGKDGSRFYTDDHYSSFREVIEG